jgi:hypothetical protein
MTPPKALVRFFVSSKGKSPAKKYQKILFFLSPKFNKNFCRSINQTNSSKKNAGPLLLMGLSPGIRAQS